MPGDSGSKTTTVQNNDPWKPSQELLKSGFNEAQQLYRSGAGFNPYPNSTVVGLDSATEKSLSGLTNVANQAIWSGSPYDNYYKSIIGSSGFAPQQSTALSAYNKALGGQYDVKGYDRALASEDYLRDLARGNQIGAMNPQLREAIDYASQKAADKVNLTASGYGRYGSGTHQGNVGREVSQVALQATLDQYNRDRAMQMQASGMIDQAQLARNAGQAGNMQRRLSGADALYNAGQQGQANVSQAFQYRQDPYKLFSQIGDVREDLRARQIQDAVRLFEGKDQEGWQRLAQAQGIYAGGGQLGGATRTSVQQPTASPWSTLAGNTLGGYALAGP